MVIRKGFYEDGNFDSKVNGEYVSYEDYAKLEAKLLEIKAAASCLVREASKVYSDYSDVIAPEFVDQQTIYELGILL
ncbi:hypothetical protein JSSK01_76 [Escherichia phage JSSK01]|nr:hypothetical protein JSSK01_76 [Escherichia phage JSSK01]